MVGSATFTIVTSSTIISTLAHSTYSAIQRERSSAAVIGSGTPWSPVISHP
jgi:hypothetical protein